MNKNIKRRHYIALFFLLAITNTVFAPAWAKGEVEQHPPRGGNPADHTRCKSELGQIAADKKAIADIIAANDVQVLRKHLLTIQEALQRLQGCMNTAMLSGVWKSKDLGPERFGILDRLETLSILNFIGLSFTSPYYANPLGTVSGSVSDSVNRFFIQLEYLRGRVKALEAMV